MVLDEVSSNLDVETARKVGKVIEEEFEGCTVLMIAHRWESLKGCDVVAVLSEGRVVEFGAPGDLMRLEGSEMRKLWGVSVDIS